MAGLVVPIFESDRSPAIQREQLKSFTLTAPTATIGGGVLGIALATGLWPLGGHGLIAGWGAALAFALLTRPALALAYRARRARLRDEQLGWWINAFRASIMAHGVMWGIAAWILFPANDTPRQFLLTFVIAIAGVGSITVASFDLFPAVAFLILTLGPLIARLLSMGGEIPTLIGGLMFLFLVFLRLNSWRADGTARDNLRLRAAAAERNRALKRSEQLLERMAEMVGVGGWELDAETLKQRWTAQTYRIHELPPDVEPDLALGLRHYAAEAQTRVKDAVDAALTKAEPFDFEAPFLTAKGRSIWVRAIGRPETEDGRVVRLSGAFQEITERREREAASRRQTEFLEALNQTTLDLLSRQSLDEVLRAIVDRATALLGATFGEMTLLEGDVFVVRASTPNHPYPTGKRLTRDDAPMSWRVHDERKAIVVDDYASWAHAPTEYDSLSLHAVAEFPILRHERILGVLSLGRAERGRPFEPEEVQRGEMFAQMAALVLHNAGIYAEAVREAEERTVAMRESEERFRRLFRHSPTTIVVASVPEGRFIDVNESASRMFGYSIDEVLGRTTDELNLWVDLEDRKRYVEMLERHGRVDGFETTLRKKNGDIVNVLFFTALLNRDGENMTSLVTVLDITARKRAEYAIRQFRAALDQSADGVYLIDPYTGRFIDLNETAHQRLGYTRAEHLALTLSDIESKDPGRLHWRDHLDALRRIGHLTHEDRHVRKDGTSFPVELNVRYIVGPPQDYMIAIVRDITDRKRTEEVMRENEERFHAVFDHSPVIIALLSIPEGRIVEVNEATMAAFGYTREEAIGRTSVELGLWASADDRETYLKRLRTEGTVSGYEVEMRRKDGTIFPALYYGRLIHIGGQMFSLNTVQDITLRKQAETSLSHLNVELESKVLARTQEMETARRQAESANEAKSQFLANMSHEIRTPLNGVLGMIDSLRQTNLRSHQTQMADLAHESATSLLSIIEDILDFSKIEAGMVEIENASLSVSGIAEKVCELLDHVAAKNGVELTLFTDPRLPEQVVGDPMRLRQVLHNIVGNAIKFTSAQPETRKVRVNVRRVEERGAIVVAEFEVIDTGIGMDERALARLFTSFAQADASITRRFGGTGLGLNISRNLAQLMGGEIHVSSEPGRGSTFTVYLPFTRSSASPSGLFELTNVGGTRCVLVGPAGGFLGALADYLEDAGAIVDFAASLGEAAGISEGMGEGPIVWIVDTTELNMTLAEARAEAVRPRAMNAQFLILGRGRRRRARRSKPNAVEIDLNVLTRRTFLRAVALAADPMKTDSAEHPARQVRIPFAPAHASTRPNGATILVAEDNRVNQMVILQQLRSLGYSADVVQDGGSALEAWAKSTYALLITDLQMPGMDGYELSAAIRRSEREMGREPAPIIALTANALTDEAERCQAAGMNDFLTKPASLPELKTLLEKWLPVQPRTAPPNA